MRFLRPDALSLFRTKVARRLLLAMTLAAVIPLVAALGVAFALLEFSIGVGLNQTVQEGLDDDLSLYKQLFDAKKSEYRAQGTALGTRFELNAAKLDDLLKAHPELARISVERVPSATDEPEVDEEGEEAEPVRGETMSSVERDLLPPGRSFDVVTRLKGGRVLRAEFHLPPVHDKGLARARELSETYEAITRARGTITRGLVLTFIIVILVVLFGAAILAGLIARSITRKVAILSSAARSAARGNLSVRVEEHWADELGDLARAFNGMLSEISESRDRIVYLEKISGWQEVARRLAHEIKNPLTPIVLAVQEIAEKVPAEPPSYARLVKTAREIVEEEVSTLRRLVQEFSDFARLPDVHMEPTDLGAFVREFVENAKDIHIAADLRLEASATTLWAGLDRLLFRRVLYNLVTNALEAQHGKLGEAPSGRRPLIVIRVHPMSLTQVALDVDDAGPGVPVADRVKIFEPYITTKRTGTGLGLAIVKKIVLQHLGSISVSQSREGGASFQLRFPQVPPPKELTSSQEHSS